MAVSAAVFATVASAGVIKPITVRAGNLVLTLGGGVVPNKLSTKKLEPISVVATGHVKEADGSHPPALQEVVINAGGKGVIEANKFPTCRQGQLEATTTETAESVCKGAIVGRGTTEVEVAFAESTPFTAKGPLVIFNGGEKGGKALMLVHTYISVPAPTAVVVPIVTTKEHKGPYLLRTVAILPKVAGGAGSATDFKLDINKKGYLLGNCSKGNFSVLTTAKFHEGPLVEGRFVQPCIPKK
jgi:hypothetical protein